MTKELEQAIIREKVKTIHASFFSPDGFFLFAKDIPYPCPPTYHFPIFRKFELEMDETPASQHGAQLSIETQVFERSHVDAPRVRDHGNVLEVYGGLAQYRRVK
jgi:hypothetical protein